MLGGSRRWARNSLGLLFLCMPLLGQAQIVSTHLAYDEQVKRNRSFAALDEDLFGDKINLQDGSVSFVQEDVSLATNSQLQVSIGRKTPTSNQGLDMAFAVFGRDWELNIPYMMGTFDTRDGWDTASGTRCSTSDFAPTEHTGPWPYYYEIKIPGFLYWHGIKISIPGRGEEQLLRVNADQVLPNNGKTYRATTKSAWRVSCLPGSAQALGEGFAVTLPNGTVYNFDWKAERNAMDVRDDNYEMMDSPQGDWHLLVPTTDIFLYVTKVTDRFGNFLTYAYDPAHPNRLTSITSNDGVRLDVYYDPEGLISTVTSGGRTWTYLYIPGGIAGFKQLQSLTLPDRSAWTFAFGRSGATTDTSPSFWSVGCGEDPKEMVSTVDPATVQTETRTMTHPSGATGEFKYRRLYHGTNNTPGGCRVEGSPSGTISFKTWGVPSAFVATSIFKKTISGPAAPARTWSYMYYPTWSFSSECGSCATTSQTTVQTGDMVLRRYTFGNSYSSNAGQLLTETVEAGGATIQRKDYAYLTSATGQPFPNNAGELAMGTQSTELYGNAFSFLNRPLRSVVTQLDGVTLTQAVNSFDIFVRPLSATKSNSLGYSKTDTTEYQDDRFRWVLGQVSRSTTNGIESGRTDYDAASLPWHTYAYGFLRQALTYYADGNLKTVTDGPNLTATVSAWKRGMPQTITYPTVPVTTQKAQVNDRGNFDWVENELGVRTSYGYDAMDRLSAITYPAGDTSVWNVTTTPLEKVTSTSEGYGILVGQWKRTETTGNGKTTTYYNALWQPVLTLTEDTGSTASRSFVVSRYDSNGRLAFASYPVGTLTTIGDLSLKGSSMEYDALGRLTKVKQDSELTGALAVLTTTTEYLPGLQTRITNPRGPGYSTTTSFQVFDSPDTSRPVLIVAPEGVTTTISRDVFGKPLTVTRSGPAG